MCGIGGAISQEDQIRSLVPLILKDQASRGPDNASSIEFSSQNLKIALAHNRLAILDLTDRSNQPFIDLQTGACIVFNGEIYNYVEIREELASVGVRFTTKSDTEVLLKAFLHWGPHVFSRLNGMFAFAVWEPNTKKLTLARDRFGVKPCYFISRPDQFSFASTTTALAQFFKLEINPEYLSRGHVYNLYEDADGSSPFKEIQCVPPGHYIELLDGAVKLHRYYDLEEEVALEEEALAGFSDEHILVRLEERLRSAVHLRLRADVPTTISLSGGLDSTLLAALMSEETNRPHEAFCFGSLDNPNSEGRMAQEAADSLGFKLHLVDEKHHDIRETFERTLRAQGAPFAHPSVMAQNMVFEAIRKHGYRVSLGGQGADEVFLGYRKFQFFNLKDLVRNGQWRSLPQSAWGLFLMLMAELGSPKKFMHYYSRYSRRVPLAPPFRSVNFRSFNIGFSGYPSLQARQIADVGFGSLATLLRYEDRNSMGHSIESRMPFLDYRVVQLGVALPARMKIHNGFGKWILRKIAENRVPSAITTSRAKLAFSLDADQWLKNGLGRHLQQGIEPSLGRLREILSEEAIRTLQQADAYLNPGYFPLLVTAYWLAREAGI